MFEKLGHQGQRAARELRVRSGLNPMLWLSAISLPICLAAAYAFRDQPHLEITLAVVGVLPVIVACLGFGYFAIYRPEKLLSEEYQIRHEAIQVLQVKAEFMPMTATSLEAIATGVLKELEAGEEDKAR